MKIGFLSSGGKDVKQKEGVNASRKGDDELSAIGSV